MRSSFSVHRENASLCRQIQPAVSESVDLKHSLSTTEKESKTWKSAAFKKTELIESLHKSIQSLESSARLTATHRDNRLASAERMIAELYSGIAERDRLINKLTRDLAKGKARHTTVQGFAANYFRQLQDATMALCNGFSHAPRVMRRTVSSQQQVV